MSYFASLMMKIGVDAKDMQVGLRKAEGEVSRFGKKLSGDFKAVAAGFFSYTAFKATIGYVTQTALKLKDLSEQYNMTTDEIQMIDKAAKGAGLSFEAAAGSLLKLDAVMASATKDQGILDIFNKAGIGIKDIESSLSSGNLFPIIKMLSEGIGNLSNSDLRELFGKSGATLRTTFEDLARISQDFKAPISEDDIKRIDDAEKAIGRMQSSIGKFLAPGTAAMANIVGNSVSMLGGMVGMNSGRNEEFEKLDKAAREIKKNNPAMAGMVNTYLSDWRFQSFFGNEDQRKRPIDRIAELSQKYGSDVYGLNADQSRKSELDARVQAAQAESMQKIADEMLIQEFDDLFSMVSKDRMKKPRAGLISSGGGLPEADSLTRIGGLGSSLGMLSIEQSQRNMAANIEKIANRGIPVTIEGGE